MQLYGFSLKLHTYNCLLTESIYKEQLLSKDAFLKEVRAGVRLIKNKIYKDKCLTKKNRLMETSDDESLDENILTVRNF